MTVFLYWNLTASIGPLQSARKYELMRSNKFKCVCFLMSFLSVHFPHLFLPWLLHFQFLKPLLHYRDCLGRNNSLKNAPDSDLLQVRCNYKPPISFYSSDFKDLKVKLVSIFLENAAINTTLLNTQVCYELALNIYIRKSLFKHHKSLALS